MAGYSAACCVVSSTGPRAVATRSSNPGFVGPNCRKYSGESPAPAPAFRIAMRRALNACTAWIDPKSATFIAQSHSSAVGVLASPSASIRGGLGFAAISFYLTIVGFSQGNDPKRFVTQRVDADVQAISKAGIGDNSIFPIVCAQILHFCPVGPIQTDSLGQRNPMFRAVGLILRLIPVKLHTPQLGTARVSAQLTGISL